jgi:hypothetical protein
LLLFLGVHLVSRARTGRFVMLALATYVLGTLFYLLLAVVGLGAFGNAPADLSRVDLATTVASTAPDVSDTLSFLDRWDSYGRPLTEGRTFYGGLLPGNYEWNPGVWTITLGQSSVDVTEVNSGGLRLPAPVWGLLSFGLPGVIGVGLVTGAFTGLLAKVARTALPAESNLKAVYTLTVIEAFRPVVAGFFALSYISVFQLVIVLLILRRAAGEGGSQAPAARDEGRSDRTERHSASRGASARGRRIVSSHDPTSVSIVRSPRDRS